MKTRQGENLSPFLFSLYLNDIETFFIENQIIGLTSISDEIAERLDIYIRLFIMLYADDAVLWQNLQKVCKIC